MAKFLVTGGAGFIGSHLVDLFVSNEYEAIMGDGRFTSFETGKRAL